MPVDDEFEDELEFDEDLDFEADEDFEEPLDDEESRAGHAGPGLSPWRCHRRRSSSWAWTRTRHAPTRPFLAAAMRECDITTKARAEMFLAQLFHESIMLSTFEEIASGAAYEGRKDLGNVQRGDGVRFKGRGPIQVTGRANYKWMSDKLGVDFVTQPKLLATPRYGYRAAAQFWTRAKLNAKADKGDFEGVTRSINGAATWNAPSHQARRVALLRACARSTCGPAARTCAAVTRATPCWCSRAGSPSSSRR